MDTKTSKNRQKNFQNGTNMAASWDTNSTKIHTKSVSRARFLGTSRNVNQTVMQESHWMQPSEQKQDHNARISIFSYRFAFM